MSIGPDVATGRTRPPDASRRVDVVSVGLGLTLATAGRLGLEGAFVRGTIADVDRRRVLMGIVVPGVARMARITDSLATGRETLAGWFDVAAGEVARLDASATLALVGPDVADDATRREFDQEYDYQYKKLVGFRDELKTGEQLLSGAVARATLYAHAAWGVGYAVERGLYGRRGAVAEARFLGTADNCIDCVAAADRGWVAYGTLPAIGETRCRARCKCWFRYDFGGS